MNLILSHETVAVNGKSIPKIYGGFGANQPSILAKQVAELHGRELFKINQLINNNLDWYEEGIDIINLAILPEYSQICRRFLLNFYTKDALNASKSVYLLSQQGYALLCRDLKSELAKKIYKQMVREYFKMAESQKIEEYPKENWKNQGESTLEKYWLSGKLAQIIIEELKQNREELNQIHLEIRDQREELSGLKERMETIEKKLDEKKNSSKAKKYLNSSGSEVYPLNTELMISSEQGQILQKLVKSKAKSQKQMFQIWSNFKKQFEVNRYQHLPKTKFEKALEWLKKL